MFQLKPISYLFLAVLATSLSACGSFRGAQPPQATPAPAVGKLAFENGLLRQTDANGKPLWQLKVQQATYSQDQTTARVKNLVGELFQDGKPVFHLRAEQGDVHLASQTITLRGSIVATDTRDKAVLRGRELIWQPQKDRLVLRQALSITHPQVQMWAREAYASSRTRQIETQGQVVAMTNQPKLRLRTERAVWQVAKQQITAGPAGNVQIERLTQSGTDRAIARQASVNLSAKTLALQSDARLILVSPPVNVASQQLVWNINRQSVFSPQPVWVYHRNQQVTVTANQGRMNLAQARVQLTGSVRTVGKRNRSLLRTDRLTWLIPTQAIEAQGNVVYQQHQPKFELRGPKAFGKFQKQAVLVSGGNVVTEIIP